MSVKKKRANNTHAERAAGKKDVFAHIDSPGLKGYLTLWILSLLNRKTMNGYELIKEISEATNRCWEPKTGSLYPALHALEKKGIIRAGKEGSRGQIVYALTPKGRKTLEEIRTHVYSVHKTHKFRRMFESMIWPKESGEVSMEIDKIHDGILKLRESAVHEKEKVRKLKKAADALLKD